MKPELANSRAKSFRFDSSGFSLTDVLIVVGILSIIAAFALLSFMTSTAAANEAAAATYMRSWMAAQKLYHTKYGYYADADNQLFNEGLIDGHAPAGIDGYTFSIDNPPGSQDTWWGRGWPMSPGVTGTRWFYIDQTGVIRYSTSGNATAGHPPLGPP